MQPQVIRAAQAARPQSDGWAAVAVGAVIGRRDQRKAVHAKPQEQEHDGLLVRLRRSRISAQGNIEAWHQRYQAAASGCPEEIAA